jgi:hypothetical protein
MMPCGSKNAKPSMARTLCRGTKYADIETLKRIRDSFLTYLLLPQN